MLGVGFKVGNASFFGPLGTVKAAEQSRARVL